MKKTVNTTKKVVKKIKPLFTVDLTTCEDASDVKLEFISAKVRKNIAISEDELIFFCSSAIEDYQDMIAKIDAELIKFITVQFKNKPKKTPWYKKLLFWKKNK